jgi:hypothetical protein
MEMNNGEKTGNCMRQGITREEQTRETETQGEEGRKGESLGRATTPEI